MEGSKRIVDTRKRIAYSRKQTIIGDTGSSIKSSDYKQMRMLHRILPFIQNY